MKLIVALLGALVLACGSAHAQSIANIPYAGSPGTGAPSTSDQIIVHQAVGPSNPGGNAARLPLSALGQFYLPTSGAIPMTGPLTAPGITSTGNASVAGTMTVGGNPLRTFLTAQKGLWVTAAGNDANDCLTFATACATVQRAVNVAMATLDGNTQIVNIQLQPGITYTGATTIIGMQPGNGWIWIGGSTGPATLTASSGNTITVQNGARVNLTNLTITNSGSGACLEALSGANLSTGAGITYGACGASQIDVGSFASFIATAGYTISGGATSHLHSHSGGNISIDNDTVTCTGSPAFSTYFAGASWSYIEAIGTTFSGCGTVTGPRFTANRNAGIRTNTNNLNFFPGNSPGTIGSDAAYDDYTINQRAITSGSSDTATSADSLLAWKSASGAAKTEALPTCGSTGPWQQFIVVDDQGDAATNNITVSAPSSTIGGAASKAVSTAYGSMTLMCDGVGNYMVLAHQ